MMCKLNGLKNCEGIGLNQINTPSHQNGVHSDNCVKEMCHLFSYESGWHVGNFLDSYLGGSVF
jgi:hypothetical protein